LRSNSQEKKKAESRWLELFAKMDRTKSCKIAQAYSLNNSETLYPSRNHHLCCRRSWSH